MAVMNVVLYPDAPLLEKAVPYEDAGPELAALADDMIETMRAHEGVGLAGPQVGLSKRIFVMQEPEHEPRCFINPEIVEKEGEELGEEGCLSMPRVYGQVPRATRIRLLAMDERGRELDVELTGFAARIVQHEYDHLEGILFPDRLDILSREDKLREWEEIRSEMNSAIRTG